MAITLGSNLSLRGKYFLDDRQSIPKTLSDLRNWDILDNPLPEGFEVYLEENKKWYIYSSENSDPNTGKFKERNKDEFSNIEDEVDKINDRIDKIEEDVSNLDKKVDETTNSINNKIDKINDKISDLEDSIDISNLADGEDLTTVEVNKEPKLKFADKLFDSLNFSGLGRKYLRKNIQDGKNILLQGELADNYTIYIIQYDYDLNGETISIPENSILKFEGGSFNNGEIVGNNSTILSPLVKIFDTTLKISGNWKNNEYYSEWFGAQGNKSFNDTSAISRCLDSFKSVKLLDNKIYKITKPLILKKGNKIYGNLNSYLYSDGTFSPITMAHSSEINNIKFILTKPISVILINSEYIHNSYQEDLSNDENIIGNFQNYNLNQNSEIKLKNITFYSNYANSVSGSYCIKIVSNGKGDDFRNLIFDNISIIGRWEFGILIDGSIDSDSTKHTEVSDIIFNNIQFYGIDNGIFIKKEDKKVLSNKKVPERIYFNYCEALAKNYSKSFAIVQSGKDIIFNGCRAKNWEISSSKIPYKIYPTSINGVFIQNSTSGTGRSVELSGGVTSTSGNYIIQDISNNLNRSSYLFNSFFTSYTNPITKQDILNLPSGVFIVQEQSTGWNTYFNLPESVYTKNGGILDIKKLPNTILIEFIPKYNTTGNLTSTSCYCIIDLVNDILSESLSNWRSDESSISYFESLNDFKLAVSDSDGKGIITEQGKEGFAYSVNGEVKDSLGYTLTKKYGTSSDLPTISDLKIPQDIGKQFFLTDKGVQVIFNGTGWVTPSGDPVSISNSGKFSERPISDGIYIGFQYFCTDLVTIYGTGGFIYYAGDGNWISSDGLNITSENSIVENIWGIIE